MKMKVFFIGLLVLGLAISSFAQSNYALLFNGADGSARATLNTGNTNSTMTMEFWFSPVTTQAGTRFLGDMHSISGLDRRRVTPFLNAGVIGIYCAPNTGDDNNAVTLSTGVVASPNVWYHLAVTINGTSLKMYVNGKLYITTSLTNSYALTGTEMVCLASDYWNTTYANIKMDEVRIWSTERSETAIKANMFRHLAGSEAGLLAYYQMSNGAGSTFSDNQTAGTYAGSLAGGATWTASAAFADSRNALDFEGTDDYIDCGNGVNLQRNGTQPFTIEVWVKPTGGVWSSLVSKFVHTGSQEGYSLELFSDNKVALLYGNNWSNWSVTTSGIALTTGIWNHIAATYDGSTVKIYINGLLSASNTWADGLTDSGTPLVIGNRNGSTFYLGQMDDVRVWNIARTAPEICESMTKTLSGTEAGLVAYYRFDETDGNVVYDLSNNLYHGTMINMDPASDRIASDAFNVWIGGNNTSWADAGNWSKGLVPTVAQSVGVYKWALGNEANISTSPIIMNMLISSTSSPSISSALTVNGNFIVEKDFNLSGQDIVLGPSSSLVEGSGFVYGVAGTISTTRNLSNLSSVNVALLGATVTTAANMGLTTITRGHAPQSGGGHVSILRYYDITPTNNTSLNASLVFNYRDTELNSLNEGDLSLYKSTDNGFNWTNESGTVSTISNTVVKSGIPSFSRWTLADTYLPLFYIPEMDIEGNGNSIVNNDMVPSIIDGTDFGEVLLTGDSVEHTFTIMNTGLGTLTLNNTSPYIVITGADTDFSITQIPSGPVAPSGSTTFRVTFNPTSTGLRSAMISIANNDTDENPYNFAIQGFAKEASSVITLAVTDISSDTATGNGDITSLGVPNPIAHGVCWNTTGNPTITDDFVDNGAASSTGAFTAPITGLFPNTTYYVRAYAINTADTSYGSEVSFTTQRIQLTIADPILAAKEYDGNTDALSVTTIGLLSGVLPGNAVAAHIASSTYDTKEVGVGKTVVVTYYLSGLDSGSYAVPLASTVTTGEISPKDLSISGLLAADKEYDGTTDASISGGILQGVISPDDVTVTMPVAGTFADKNTGTAIAVTLANLVLHGSDSANYELTQPAGLSADITAKGLTIGGSFTVEDKVYDGTTAATIATDNLILEGLIPSESVDLMPVAEFSSAAIATNVIVILNAFTSISGLDHENYLLSMTGSPTTTASILADIGVNELSKNNIILYPNPFTDQIYLSTAENVAKVILTDVTGKIIVEQDLNGSQIINTSTLLRGVYFITLLFQNNEQQVLKLVK